MRHCAKRNAPLVGLIAMQHDKPKVGDYVHVHHIMTDTYHAGEVVDLLSVQFMYITKTKAKRFCHYADDWTTAAPPDEPEPEGISK